MGKVIVFNSPPGAGKDAAADHLKGLDRYAHADRRQFKDRLFEITCAIHGVSVEEFTGPMYTRKNKEKPYEVLGGLSPRQALIQVSEDIIKPNFSKFFFGRAMAQALKDDELTFISDSGFIEELVPVALEVGHENVFVVRVFRPGYDYNNDSRDYLDPDELEKMGILNADIFNEGTIEQFLEKVELVADFFIKEEGRDAK